MTRRTRLADLARHPLCVAALLACASPMTGAQTTPAAAATAEENPSVVTITAQRRLEELQKTPLAVTAISAREMEARQIRRLEDLKLDVPNVVIEQNTGTSSAAKVFMRGVGTDESLFTADPSVAIYIDDMYVARQTGAMFDMFDLARVEVLRGPQGTLYGRNATGGAIRYITKAPNGQARLEVDARVGNLGRMDINLSGGGSAGEGINFTFGVMSKERDGYLRDITNNRDVNDEKIAGLRAAFGINLGAANTLRISADALRQRSGPTYASGVLDAAGAARFNRPVNNADGNLLTIETNLVDGKNEIDQAGVSFTLTTDLGAFEWRNIATYRKMDNLLYIDLDGSTATRFHLFQDQAQKQASYESQLISTGKGPLSWQGGFYAFKESNNQPTRQDIFAPGGVTVIGQSTLAMALYGQGDWRFGGIFKATGGLRYSRETKDFGLTAARANGTALFDYAAKNTWTRTDWKLGVDAQINNDLMVYGSATTGFKSGGFNGRAGSVAAATVVLKPETVLTYEIGARSTLLGGMLRLNGTLFRNDYKDLQLTAFNAAGVSVLTNAASATISGVEIDAALQLTKGFGLSANIGTLDAEYRDFSAANAATFTGRQLKQAPKVQVGVSANMRQPVGAGTLFANVGAKHVGDHFQNLTNSQIIKTEAYTLVDARVGYEATGGAWSVALWGKNLSDKRYYTGGFDLSGLTIADAYLNVPRTYGVDLRYRFW